MMKRNVTFFMLVIAMIVGMSFAEAKKTSSSGRSSFSASTLIGKMDGYVVLSSRCQSNLKKAGFTLTYTRTVQLHDVDDEYNDILVDATEKNYSKNGILVRLYYLWGDEDPCSIEIEFPNQTTKNSFMRSLTSVGFIGENDSYVAYGSGLFAIGEGNTVTLCYSL